MTDAWTKRLLRRFLLTDAESLARRLGDPERRLLRDQIARARQKVESAKVLCSSEQYVEGLRFCAEGLTESLRAVEVAGAALAEPAGGGGGRGDGDDRAWEAVLLRLGASSEEILQTRAALAGVGPTRPTLNDEVSPRHRRYMRTAVSVAENTLRRIGRLASAPSRIVASRFLRVGVPAFILIAGITTMLGLRGKVWVVVFSPTPTWVRLPLACKGIRSPAGAHRHLAQLGRWPGRAGLGVMAGARGGRQSVSQFSDPRR
jgi:hypothetical protein